MMNKLELIIDYWEEKRLMFYDLKEGSLSSYSENYLDIQNHYNTICLFLKHLKELRDE